MPAPLAEGAYLALMERFDSATSEPRYVLAPVGHLAPGDPFASDLPPAEDGGFAKPE